MQTLTYEQTLEFLKHYLEGLLQLGSIEPLRKMAETDSTPVGLAAKSFYEYQISGIPPDSAVVMVQPAFPYRVSLLVALGFQQSNIDLVMTDLIKVLENGPREQQIEALLVGLIEKYSHLKTDEICFSCASQEINKINKRSELESAQLVIVDYGEGCLRQRFVGAKLVEFRTAAIPAVYSTLKQTFEKLSMGDKTSDISVNSIGTNTFKVKSECRSYTVEFLV